MSAELELIDQLLAGSMPYPLMERHVFDSDRRRFLNSLWRMLVDGPVRMAVDDTLVEAWQIETWSRHPFARETERDLQRGRLWATEAGVRLFS